MKNEIINQIIGDGVLNLIYISAVIIVVIILIVIFVLWRVVEVRNNIQLQVYFEKFENDIFILSQNGEEHLIEINEIAFVGRSRNFFITRNNVIKNPIVEIKSPISYNNPNKNIFLVSGSSAFIIGILFNKETHNNYQNLQFQTKCKELQVVSETASLKNEKNQFLIRLYFKPDWNPEGRIFVDTFLQIKVMVTLILKEKDRLFCEQEFRMAIRLYPIY